MDRDWRLRAGGWWGGRGGGRHKWGAIELFNVVRGTHAWEKGTFQWRHGGEQFGVQEKSVPERDTRGHGL